MALKRGKWGRRRGHPRENLLFIHRLSRCAPLFSSIEKYCKFPALSRGPPRAISREKDNFPTLTRRQRIFIVFTSSSTCHVSLTHRRIVCLLPNRQLRWLITPGICFYLAINYQMLRRFFIWLPTKGLRTFSEKGHLWPRSSLRDRVVYLASDSDLA